MPWGSRAKWSSWGRTGAAGVRHVWRFDPRQPGFAMKGATAPQSYRSGFAVVFFDFRAASELDRPWVSLPGAEVYRSKSERVEADICLGRTGPTETTFASLGMNGSVVVGELGLHGEADNVPSPLPGVSQA